MHGDNKPLNILICSDNDEFIILFKITGYSCSMNKTNAHTQISSKSVLIKQLMTPAYIAPELLGDNGCHNEPTMASDVYSLGILGYEVILYLSPWKHVSIDLIDHVKRGRRPPLPDDAPVAIANILQRCWQHSHTLRPHASEVSAALEHYVECKSVQVSTEGEGNTEASFVDDIETATDDTPLFVQNNDECGTQEMLENSQISVEEIVDSPCTVLVLAAC